MDNGNAMMIAEATIGMDLGDKFHHFCVLDAHAEVVEEGKIAATQHVVAVLRSRDALVRSRTLLINHCRGIVKSLGERLPSCSAAAAKTQRNEPPWPWRAS